MERTLDGRHRVSGIAHALVACLLLIASATAWAGPQATSQPPTQAQRIEALIAAVGQLRGATFIRNGSEHTAAEAADHLRLKWKNAGKRVRTAEDFIRYCATQSSMSGRKYRIRLSDGRELDSADWFHAELRRYDAAHAARPAATPKPAPASSPG
jgi:hypothetical protein